MYLCGYSLDNLSLMALTVSTGFVVDDAIVVLENITRHIEAGMSRFEAALLGAREVGFTVLSMTLSLIAVFVPILLMGGIVGRYFREFAMVLSIAILISMVVSLTTTPMMCAYIAIHRPERRPSRWHRASEWVFQAMLGFYARTLAQALRWPAVVMAILLVTVGLNVYLFVLVPKGFFPQQDTGRMIGGIRADQSISFQLMRRKLNQFMRIIGDDPAVASVVGFTGGGQTNSGFVFISLKPLAERQAIGRPGDRPGCGRSWRRSPARACSCRRCRTSGSAAAQSSAQYQYTLQSDDLPQLYEWVPKITAELEKLPQLTDVNSDQEQKGLQTELVIDRATAARLGITTAQIDQTLYDAFGQRQVSIIYTPRNQYHVVMEVAPQYWQSPDTLEPDLTSAPPAGRSGAPSRPMPAPAPSRRSPAPAPPRPAASTAVRIASDAARNQATNAIANSGRGATSTGAAVSTTRENMVPLSAVAHYEPGSTPLAVNHQGLFAASTISFNLKEGVALGEASQAIEQAMARLQRAGDAPRHLPGHRPGVPGIAEKPALPDRDRAARGLHRAGRAV